MAARLSDLAPGQAPTFMEVVRGLTPIVALVTALLAYRRMRRNVVHVHHHHIVYQQVELHDTIEYDEQMLLNWT